MFDCPLCASLKAEVFQHSENRDYCHCQRCDLIFVPKKFHLSVEKEQEIYSHHQNNPQDSEYRKFLARCLQPIQSQLKPGMTGLDFGSGPGPTLHLLLGELGVDTVNYDVYFDNQPHLLESCYDIVTCTEVIEHIALAVRHWSLLFNLVKPNGVLSIMTKRHQGLEKFKHWHYKLDPTHIVFYSEHSLNWVANQWRMQLELYQDDIAIFQSISSAN
jgi:hypothetical protein